MPDLARVLPPFILLLISLGTADPQQTWGEVTSSNDYGGYSYVYITEVLQMNCTLTESSGWQANDLTFTLKNDTHEGSLKLPEEEVVILNNITAQLNHRVRGKKDSGKYACQIESPQGPLLVGSQEVYVQYRPENVTPHCEVKDWNESLKCSWGYSEGYVNNSNSSDFSSPDVSVIVGLKVLIGRGVTGCSHPVSAYEGRSQCEWSGDHFLAAPHYKLLVGIINTVTHERRWTQHIILTNDVVKPSPVSLVWTTEVNSTCVSLAWNHMKKYRDMLYRVNMTATGFSHELNSSSITLCGLQPYRRYNVSVECRPRDTKNRPSGFWSEANRLTVRTTESVPNSSFPMQNGSYILGPCRGGRRNVTIFWKELPADKRNGEIIGYQLHYNGTIFVEHVTSPTSAVMANVACGSEISVRIFARTKVGPSKSNARLIINTDDGQPLADFAVEMLDRGVNLVWNNTTVDNETDLTLFWCPRDKTTFDRTCRSEARGIQWADAAFSAGGMTLPQLSTRGLRFHPRDYLFGVSRAGGAIVWASCYFRRQAPMEAPEMSVKVGDEQLDVEWNPQQCSERYPVHTTGYRLTYCKQDHCPNGPQTEVVDGGKTSYNLRATPGATYNVSIEAVDIYGRHSPPSLPQVRAIPLKEASFPVWGMVTLTVLLVVFIFLILCCAYRMFHRIRSDKAKFSQNFKSTLGTLEEQWQGHDLSTPSSPSLMLEQDPHTDSEADGASCKTTLTDVEPNPPGGGAAALGSSHYQPHPLSPSAPHPSSLRSSRLPPGESEAPTADSPAISLTELSPTGATGISSRPQNLQFSPPPGKGEAPNAKLSANIPLIDINPTGAGSSSGPLSTEGIQRHTLSGQALMPENVVACVPESSSVAGGKKADHVTTPPVSSVAHQNAVGKKNDSVAGTPYIPPPAALMNQNPLPQLHSNPFLDSSSDCSLSDIPLEVSSFDDVAVTRTAMPELVPTTSQNASSFPRLDGSGDIPPATIQNDIYVARPETTIHGGYVPKPQSSASIPPATIHSAGYVSSDGSTTSQNARSFPRLDGSGDIPATKQNASYVPKPESSLQNTNKSYDDDPAGMGNISVQRGVSSSGYVAKPPSPGESTSSAGSVGGDSSGDDDGASSAGWGHFFTPT